MKKSPVIYGFGSACVDYRIHIPDMGVGYTAKILADEVGEFGGGACANCLVQAARLGADCTYIGKLGNDPHGSLIKSLLASENIKTEILDAEDGIISPFNIAVYKGDDNERVGGYLLPNSLGSISQSDAVNLARRMVKGSYVMVEIGEIPLESVLAFLKIAKKQNVQIFIDIDLDPIRQMNASLTLFEEILSLADMLIPNYDAMKSIYTDSNPKQMAGDMNMKFNKTIVITAGETGVYYHEPDSDTVHIAAGKINVVDTVGAGDSFHGSLIYALGTGSGLDAAVRLAMKCAQITCTGFGARPSMPYIEDIT